MNFEKRVTRYLTTCATGKRRGNHLNAVHKNVIRYSADAKGRKVVASTKRNLANMKNCQYCSILTFLLFPSAL